MSNGSIGLKMLRAVAAQAEKGMDEGDIKRLENQFKESFPKNDLDVRHAAFMLEDLYVDRREWSEIVSRYGLNENQQVAFKRFATKHGIQCVYRQTSKKLNKPRDLTSASVKRALDRIYVGVPNITQFKPRGDSPHSYLYTFKIGWRQDWSGGVLHFERTTTIHFNNRCPVVEYKVNSIQGKIAVVTILTADGSKTVLRGNIEHPDLFSIVKNPTHARIKRFCTPGIKGCGGTIRLPGCGAII